MTPQKLIEAMVMIAEAAVDEHTNRNSDYGGVSIMRAKEDAIKLLQESYEASDLVIAEHENRRLLEENGDLNHRIDSLLESNRDLKQRLVVLTKENEKLKRDYCGF